MKSTIDWNEYPDTTPEEWSMDVIILTKKGEIRSVFYTAEDSSHDHSPWQDCVYWIYSKDLVPEGFVQ